MLNQESAIDQPSFSNTDVILTSISDRGLASLNGAACWAEQQHDGPTYLVIRPNATDEQLLRVTKRYNFSLDELINFRQHNAV